MKDSIYDLIDSGLPTGAQDGTPFRFRVGYQGETDYGLAHTLSTRDRNRVSFRYGKVPWKWSWEPKSYWNYPDEGSFDRSGPNAAHGLLLCGIHPVPRHVLALFRKHHYATAVTGYWCSDRKTFVRLDLREAFGHDAHGTRFFTIAAAREFVKSPRCTDGHRGVEVTHLVLHELENHPEPKPAPSPQALIEFAQAVLSLLTTPDWDVALLDDIAAEAYNRNLAHSGENDLFTVS